MPVLAPHQINLGSSGRVLQLAALCGLAGLLMALATTVSSSDEWVLHQIAPKLHQTNIAHVPVPGVAPSVRADSRFTSTFHGSMRPQMSSSLNTARESALDARNGTALFSSMVVASVFAMVSALGALFLRQRRPSSMSLLSAAGETSEESWQGAQLWSGLTKEVKTITNCEDIQKVLPHRYPFLLVDKVIEYEPGKRAVGIKNVTANEPQFTGHFPGRPIMPGVLMLEAMAQLGGIVCLQPPVSDGTGIFFFAGINGVRWRRPVVPGDTLVMEMELVTFRQKFGIAKMKGKAYVDGALAVEVEEFTFAMVKE